MAYARLVLLVAPRAVFPVVVDRPEMLGIMAHVQGSFCGVFCTSRCVPLVVLVARRQVCIMAGMDQRDSYVASMVQTAENSW